MSYYFGTVLTAVMSVLALLFGAFFFISPVIPPGDSTAENTTTDNGSDTVEPTNVSDAEMQNAIAEFIDDFAVEISPWTPSGNPEIGERVQLSITNTSPATYNFITLHIVFVDDSGSPIKAVTAGSYSEFIPGSTKNMYISAAGIEGSSAFVYDINNNQF